MQPLFYMGFRPFFLGATAFAVISVSLWAAVYLLHLPLPMKGLSSYQWHAHEMIYGYSMAVIAGFLRTRFEVNEIFAGLGLNFVALGVTLSLIFGPWKRPGVASMSGTELFPPSVWLRSLPLLRLSPIDP